MKKRAHQPKRLRAEDFAGDGEPYSEVTVTISIRILGTGITRSRLAVNVCPDPALEPLARKSLDVLKKENYGFDDDDVFGVCLSKNFNGWEDLDEDYPRIDERGKSGFDKDRLKAMNAYIKESVDWALALNKQGMEEAVRQAPKPGGKDLVM
jgi:hypothetical protein